jgi:cell division protein FtsZ
VRVTVVATGLGEHQQVVAPEVRSVPRAGGQIDYKTLDLPTVMRNKPPRDTAPVSPPAAEHDADYLDIPAFLRRQAD